MGDITVRHLGIAALAAAIVAAGTIGPASAREKIPASVCLDQTQGKDRAMCVMLIGVIRKMMHDGRPTGGFTACSHVDPHDLSDTYAIMDWIRVHPERQPDDLFDVAPEVLQKLHPC
jgi:hypothetical protein